MLEVCYLDAMPGCPNVFPGLAVQRWSLEGDVLGKFEGSRFVEMELAFGLVDRLLFVLLMKRQRSL